MGFITLTFYINIYMSLFHAYVHTHMWTGGISGVTVHTNLSPFTLGHPNHPIGAFLMYPRDGLNHCPAVVTPNSLVPCLMNKGGPLS